MAPSKRRKTSAVSQPTSGNASSGPQTRRSASARGDPPDAPDADLDAVDECVPFSPDGNVATVIYSHIADVQTRGALAMASRSWRDVSMLPASLPRRLDLDGLSKSQIDRLLDVDGLTSLDEERMLELAGVDKEDFCEWAAARAGCLKLIVWALERGFPWGGYPPGLVSDDVLALRMWRANDVYVLRTWRAMCPELQEWWPEDEQPEDEQPEDWWGVTIENGRVVELLLEGLGLTGAVPAEVGRLSALKQLNLSDNQLTSVPAEIGQLTSLVNLDLSGNQLTSVPAEIGQLTSLVELDLGNNQLTSVPAEIGQLTSLQKLWLSGNTLTSAPAEIGQLTSLQKLWLSGNQLTSVAAEIGQLTSLTELNLNDNQLTSVPAEIGQLTSLVWLNLAGNQVTSLPAEIGQLTSLKGLFLRGNQLSCQPWYASAEQRGAPCIWIAA